jgi:hypothetical protein
MRFSIRRQTLYGYSAAFAPRPAKPRRRRSKAGSTAARRLLDDKVEIETAPG